MTTCRCFGRLALRIGLIGADQLRAAQDQGAPIEEALVRRGDLTPALADRVRDALAASGCPHEGRVDAA